MKKVFEPKKFVGMNLYIKPNSIIALPEWDRERSGLSVAQLLNLKNLDENKHNNDLSKKAISKLRTAINWLTAASEPKQVFHKEKNYWFEFKISFITLTIPYCNSAISDKVLKKDLLNPYLTYLRKYCGLNNYVWKLEFQSNGTPHIHFTTDSFIHHAKLRSAWNRILRANNLIEDYHNRFKGLSFDEYNLIVNPSRKKEMAKVRVAYDKGNASNWLDPNSTDVHSVQSILDLPAYICKYMAKEVGNTSLKVGRIWGCSQELSNANLTRTHVPADDCLSYMQCLTKSHIESKEIGFMDKVTGKLVPMGELFYTNVSDYINYFKGYIKEAWQEAISLIRGTTQIVPQFHTV